MQDCESMKYLIRTLLFSTKALFFKFASKAHLFIPKVLTTVLYDTAHYMPPCGSHGELANAQFTSMLPHSSLPCILAVHSYATIELSIMQFTTKPSYSYNLYATSCSRIN